MTTLPCAEKGTMRCPCITTLIFLVLGAAFLVVGLILFLDFLPNTVDEKIQQNLALRNGTVQADRFVKSPVPIYFSFYLFNVTNKDEVNSGGVPVLEQLGPYVYREEKFKEIISWNENHGTLIYKERRTYYFQPEMTNGSLDDSVNHVNAVSLTIAYLIEEKLGVLSRFAIPLIKGKYVETHTVRELLFEGFNIKEYLPKFADVFCPLMNDCHFGFYSDKNATTGKEYEVSSGVLSMKDYTLIKEYDYKPELPYWFGETCDDLNGTDGQQFPPGVKKEDTPYVFTDDLCRSLRFGFDTEVTVMGIDGYRFLVPDIVFADPNIVKENMCFCQYEDETQPCPSKAGVIPLLECEGKPIMASAPHFYQASPEYWQRYKGLHPDKEKHETFLDIEPITGQVISAAKRIQISLYVTPNDRLHAIKDIVKNTTYFPIFWVEERGMITEDLAKQFLDEVISPYNLAKWGLIAVTIVGGVILLLITAIYIYKRLTSNGLNYRSMEAQNTKVETEDVAEETENKA